MDRKSVIDWTLGIFYYTDLIETKFRTKCEEVSDDFEYFDSRLKPSDSAGDIYDSIDNNLNISHIEIENNNKTSIKQQYHFNKNNNNNNIIYNKNPKSQKSAIVSRNTTAIRPRGTLLRQARQVLL